jgi:GR25 family glycosyltransferase involved in LPS biosynthesis
MKIYVVSCNTDRVVRLKNASLPLNLDFEVVDSPWYTDEEVQRRSKECIENNMSYPTGFAATLGHLRAMKRFLETQDELCMIIEDDVRFHKQFNDIIPYVETYMRQSKYDMFSVGFVNIPSTSYGRRVIRLVDRDVIEGVHISNPWGCQCYMVSRPYATKLVNFFSNDNIYEVYKERFVTDSVLFDSIILGCKRSTFIIPIVAEHPDEITLAGNTNKPILFNERILYKHQFYL